jgi:hypothetical protein
MLKPALPLYGVAETFCGMEFVLTGNLELKVHSLELHKIGIPKRVFIGWGNVK